MLDRPNTREAWQARALALKPETRAFIDGGYRPAISGNTFARTSPIDGRVFAHVADCDAADIDLAVAAARRAFESGEWRDAPPVHKKQVLLRFAELIRTHTDEIALLETLDVGKVMDNARNDMRVAQEEIFGPVVVVIPFEDEAEAIRLANDSIYGLGAAVWTTDMNAAHRVSRAVKAGTVWVNTFDRSSLTTPFGGFKQSGFGRDRSPHAVEKYMDFKTIWTAYQ